MKETSKDQESLEYRLDCAPDLRCEKKTDLVPVCQICETCVLAWRVFSTKEWFLRASEVSQRKFLVGIVKRFNSLDLLNYAEKVLQTSHGKDFTFSRSRITPSLKEDMTTSTSDRALNIVTLEKAMLETWKWFKNCSYWTKANYTLLLLQMCNPKLLFIAANLVRVLLVREQSASSKRETEDEKDKITVVFTETQSSFKLEEHTKSSSQVQLRPTSQSFLTSSTALESGVSSEGTSQFSDIGIGVQGQIPCFWPRDLAHMHYERAASVDDDISSMSSIDPASAVVPAAFQSASNVNKYKDFIRCLPTHLSKYILGFLDTKSLNRCTSVNQHWAFLAKQVKQEHLSHSLVVEEIVYLQGSCPRGVIPSYAKMTNVVIPRINKDGDIIPARGRRWKRRGKEENNLQAAYHGQMTETVQLEERNIFCGSYNVRVLTDQSDPHRVIHYSGGNLLAIGSLDRKVRFLDVLELKEVPPVISGHAGSIKAVFLNEKKGFVLSASFDLSIRCWNIFTGACVKILNGHSGTITCLDVYKNRVVSGARDCMVKVWDLSTGRCIKTLKHKDAIWTAKINNTHIVSGCEKGLVKVWHVDTCVLIKTLEGHQGPVKSLAFDQWHLVTGSSDGFVLGWSMVGKHKRCLMAFRHPQEVLYLAFLYLRVISGCADGKIRIFNFLTGTCLKVMRANSRGDPVVSFCIVENRMVINALSSVLMFQFEDVEWDYTLQADREEVTKDKEKHKEIRVRVQPYPYVRAQHMKRDAASHRKIYYSEEKPDEDQIMLAYLIRRRSTRGSGTPSGWTPITGQPWGSLLCCSSCCACSVDKHRNSVSRTVTLVPIISPLWGFHLSKEDQTGYHRHQLTVKSLPYIRIYTESDIFFFSSCLSLDIDSESGYDSPVHASSLAENAEAALQRIKKRGPHCLTSPDQILLTVSTLQHAYKPDQVSSNMLPLAKIRDVGGPRLGPQECPKKMLSYKIPKQEKKDQSTQLRNIKSASGSLTMKRTSTPFETKRLQLNLKNSLHGSAVHSFIPAPVIVRSKSCCSLPEEKKVHTGHGRATSLSEGGAQLIGHLTSSSESIKSTRMMIAQTKIEAGPRRESPLFLQTANPYRLNTGFRLLTVKQMKMYEEATAVEYQAHRTKRIADQQKECRKAWLKKIKGLPIDNFTKEGKIAAPELGLNVYV
ncbi:CMT1A duplicated region transcript 1 protein [Trachemys scripta elegans]|uniref:CMT1A duplicated region transcript 1 protein n=1 Tax=Trachemys scripta elegans TaxID=31138 RepID=UPI0015532E39|nr:CMT1A duplicated region transcript 1 protein [Trachemys scripta elegans]